MAKSLIIIPDSEVYDLDIYKKTATNKQHKGLLMDFIYEFGLNIDCNRKTGYELSAEIALLGHIPILIEDKFMIPFLPPEITKEQNRWFKTNYDIVNKFDLSYYTVDEEKVTPVDITMVEDIPIIKMFYKELKERTKTSKIKIKK